MVKWICNRGVIFSACVALFLSACDKETPIPLKKVKTEVHLSSSGVVLHSANYEYNSDGKVSRISHPSGDYHEYDYSKSGSIRITHYTKCSEGSTCISGYESVVDIMPLNSMGYRSETTYTKKSGTNTTNYRTKYEYDNMGFLSKMTITATGDTSYVETISDNNTYENGNIIKSSVTSSTILNNGTTISRSYAKSMVASERS